MSSHDGIMIWLDSNAEAVVRSVCPADWSETDRAQWGTCNAAPLPQFAPLIVRKVWESPVVQTHYGRYGEPSNRIQGYVDFAVFVNIPEVHHWIEDRVQMCAIGSGKQELLFEVKPRIDSIGEVIRQVRRYKVYRPGRYFVCSPDTRFRELLREQHIGFVEAPGGQSGFDFSLEESGKVRK